MSIMTAFGIAHYLGHRLDSKSFCVDCKKQWKDIKGKRCELEFLIKKQAKI